MMILEYLEGTMYCSHCYQEKELNLIDYPNVNWVCDLDAQVNIWMNILT